MNLIIQSSGHIGIWISERFKRNNNKTDFIKKCCKCNTPLEDGEHRWGLYSEFICFKCYPLYLKHWKKTLKEMKVIVDRAETKFNNNKEEYKNEFIVSRI